MISFECDYNNGAHPKVLEALVKSNDMVLSGYGVDPVCLAAKEKIKAACGLPDAQVQLLVGGTQTNQIVIDSLLRSYEGVVAAATGHINVHEAGAIEFGGHKVIALPQYEGRIDAADLKKLMENFYLDESREHTVFPAMVYISHPTEYGTLYTLEQLTAISEVCRQYSLPLFLDGARLGYGLMSRNTNVSLQDIARLCDVFYIGGTKVGALCGEAVVYTKGNMPEHITPIVKQHGALLAKGRLLGVQFDALFTDDLYFEIGRHAIDKAEALKAAFAEKGYEFFIDSPTNQQFIVLPNEKVDELRKELKFEIWERPDSEHTVVRFVTSWATTDEHIEALKKLI
ncbi:MAG: aminotransferase class I/II-fold pyridoxal phosphate-dependent enzyme [Clostridia bacterium]|nr:aminotransferase class I/II-fold pyridoxal phosphate-dependent enzyme [Clostridia bacterium]